MKRKKQFKQKSRKTQVCNNFLEGVCINLMNTIFYPVTTQENSHYSKYPFLNIVESWSKNKTCPIVSLVWWFCSLSIKDEWLELVLSLVPTDNWGPFPTSCWQTINSFQLALQQYSKPLIIEYALIMLRYVKYLGTVCQLFLLCGINKGSWYRPIALWLIQQTVFASGTRKKSNTELFQRFPPHVKKKTKH